MISVFTEITGNKGWIEMWCIAAALFFAAKATVVWGGWNPQTSTVLQSRSDWSTFAFIALWPGMDQAAFERCTRKELQLLPQAVFNLALGGLLVWVIAREMPNRFAGTWVCMVGFIIALHGGLFTLLAAFWRARGRDVAPLMNCPAAAASVTEFWGKRWNLGFRDVSHFLVFKPVARRFGAAAAMWAVFVASGLLHELVITVPARGGYGGPTVYFTLQALCMSLERGCPFAKNGILWRLRALAFLIAPLPLCFPAPFIERVATPFFTSLHAL